MVAVIIDFDRASSCRATYLATHATLAKAVQKLVTGETEVALRILAEFVEATFGFEKLAEATGIDAPGLRRMLFMRGNPTAHGLLGVVSQIQKCSRVEVTVVPSGR